MMNHSLSACCLVATPKLYVLVAYYLLSPSGFACDNKSTFDSTKKLTGYEPKPLVNPLQKFATSSPQDAGKVPASWFTKIIVTVEIAFTFALAKEQAWRRQSN
jgi:hypothetical protein